MQLAALAFLAVGQPVDPQLHVGLELARRPLVDEVDPLDDGRIGDGLDPCMPGSVLQACTGTAGVHAAMQPSLTADQLRQLFLMRDR